MRKFYLEIIETTPTHDKAIFIRNDGAYGWLETLRCDVEQGDILEEIVPESFTKTGRVECLINKRKQEVYINDYGFEQTIHEQFARYTR